MSAAATHEASRSYRDVLRKRHVAGPPPPPEPHRTTVNCNPDCNPGVRVSKITYSSGDPLHGCSGRDRWPGPAGLRQ